MKHLLPFCFLVLTINAQSQPTLHDRLRSKKIDQTLFLQLDKTSLTWQYNTVLPIFPTGGGTLKDGKIFGTNEDAVLVRLEFLNPLKYKVSVQVDQEEDPSQADVRKLLDAIAQVFTTVGGTTIALPTEEIAKIQGNAPAAINPATVADISKYKSADLLPILLQLYGQQGLACVPPTDQAQLNTFQQLINGVELYLNSDFIADYTLNGPQKTTSKEFSKHLFDVVNDVYNQTDWAKFSTQLDLSTAILGGLNDYNDARTKDLPEILKAFDKINYDTRDPWCTLLKNYAKASLGGYVSRLTDEFAQRKQKISKAKEIIEYAKTFYNKYKIEVNSVVTTVMQSKEVTIDRGQISKVRIDVEEYNFTQSDGLKKAKSSTLTFRLAEHTVGVFELSTGVAYTSLEYSTYSTESTAGGLVVAKAQTTQQNLAGTIFGNFVFRPNLGGVANPVLQLGVATSKTYPSILLGGGFRFFAIKNQANLALTGGWLYGWTQELRDLKEGQIVPDQAKIDKDLHYVFNAKPNFYIGLTFKIGI